jgi:hypothetical protein
MCEGISKYYLGVIAPIKTVFGGGGVQKVEISPISRINFLTGSTLAIGFLVQDVAKSVFSFFELFLTRFANEECADRFLKNVKQIPVHLGAIPVGYLGALFPQTVNEHLGIPANSLIITGEKANEFVLQLFEK